MLLVVGGALILRPPAHVFLGLCGLSVLVFRELVGNTVTLDGIHSIWSWILACAAFILFALGVWMDSDTVQTWSLALLWGLWICGISGRNRALPLFLLLGLVCLPMGILEDTLLVQMQRVAAGFASWALDVQGIPHLSKGAVIETANGALFVEEACSGMTSLLTGLIVTQIYFGWWRMRLVMSLVGLAVSASLLFAGNCLRIVLVAVAYSKWAIDWTSGWRHEASGLLVYVLVLALLPGLRQMLLMMKEGFLRWRFPWIAEGMGLEQPEEGSAVDLKAIVNGLIRTFPVSAAWATWGITMVTMLAWAFIGSPIRTARASSWPSLQKAEPSRMISGWTLDPAGRETAYLKTWALNHQVWLYRKGNLKAWISADLPFEEIHTLPNCYSVRDWRVLRNEPMQVSDTDPLNVMELKSRGDGGALLVMFSNFDLSRWKFVPGVPSRLEGRWAQVTSRLLLGPGKDARNSGPFCQMQLVLDGGDAMESAAGEEALQLFTEVRRNLVDALRSPVGKDATN